MGAVTQAVRGTPAGPQPRPRALRVRPEHVFKVLIAISLFFFAVTLFERIWEQSHSNLGGLGVRFDTHEEGNLPTWFSGAMLLAAAGLFLLIAAARRAAGEARRHGFRIPGQDRPERSSRQLHNLGVIQAARGRA